MLPSIPPSVARFDVEVSGPKRRPSGRTWWFSSSCTSPGWTRAHSSSVFTSSTWFMYREKSRTSAWLTVCPVSDVPPPRGRTRHAELARRHLEGRLHVVGVARHDDADRLHLVHRGVGRVEEPRGGRSGRRRIDCAKLALEVVHRAIIRYVVDARSLGRRLGVLLTRRGSLAAGSLRGAHGARLPRQAARRSTSDSRELIGKKVLVLRFQASYCKPCAKRVGALAKRS